MAGKVVRNMLKVEPTAFANRLKVGQRERGREERSKILGAWNDTVTDWDGKDAGVVSGEKDGRIRSYSWACLVPLLAWCIEQVRSETTSAKLQRPHTPCSASIKPGMQEPTWDTKNSERREGKMGGLTKWGSYWTEGGAGYQQHGTGRHLGAWRNQKRRDYLLGDSDTESTQDELKEGQSTWRLRLRIDHVLTK